MSSYSGFLRKAPISGLKAFFDARSVEIPADFNWTSEGRGKELVASISEVMGNLPDRQQDAIRAELDYLSSLADDNGLLSAEQVCAGEEIDLEHLEGVQDVLLKLAIDYPQALERVAMQASLNRRTGGKAWAAFQIQDDGSPWALDNAEAREGFLVDAIRILELPEHRKREADWYKTIKVHPITGEETELVQATIYVEERSESELAFGQTATLERHVVQKVLEVGIACDTRERIIEICCKGGKKVRDQYAASFAKHFAPKCNALAETPRREVLLHSLRHEVKFETEPSDSVEKVEVSSLEFFSAGGGIARFERRGEDETIYQFLERRFGHQSPLQESGWQIYSTTLRIVMSASPGQRRKTLTVTLRAPNTTTVPNKTEDERQFVVSLLERWKLLAPLEERIDVIGTD